METQSQPIEPRSPSGVSLKAAYLLLREMHKSLEPPSIESLALLLEDVLHYEHAVRLIRVVHDLVRDDLDVSSAREGLEDFNTWAEQTLVSYASE